MSFALFSQDGFQFFLRYLHISFGVTWVGLLYYFNFIQGAFFAETDAPTKSNAIQKLVPRALWWFRWSAMGTFLTGALLLGAIAGSYPGFFASSRGVLISMGAFMAFWMWFNVWFVIWPNQKVVIKNATDVAQGKPADPTAAACGAKAGLASRTNTLFSIPMLFFMASSTHLPLVISPDKSLTALIVAYLVIVLGIEFNGLKGKTGPITSIKGVIHCGFALTAVLYVLVELLTK